MVSSTNQSNGVAASGLNGHVNGNQVNGNQVNGNQVSGKHVNGEIKYSHDYVNFDPSLKPKSYNIKGTDANSKVLFQNVMILDSTGRQPYHGDVYIEG